MWLDFRFVQCGTGSVDGPCRSVGKSETLLDSLCCKNAVRDWYVTSEAGSV